LDVWTEESGRLSLVAKSARGNRSRFRGQLEPFSPLLISWAGRNDLKNLTHAEVAGMPFNWVTDALWCAFYLNELILRLFPSQSPYPVVFSAYEQTLYKLKETDLQTPLRHFECILLQELGYEIPLRQDTQNNSIKPDQCYRFFPEKGFESCHDCDDTWVFSGATLLALQEKQPIVQELQQEAKRLLRISLQPLLGNKPLKSRQFFVSSI
jgi:DNA repair protein RecO (recombination protein O)